MHCILTTAAFYYSASFLHHTCRSSCGQKFVKLKVMTSLDLGSYVLTPETNERQCLITYHQISAPSEDSDQTAHLHWAHFGKPRMQSFFHANNKDSY